MSLVLDEHRYYLADRPRIEAYRAALAALVRPGDVVLDLACGTGILGFLACDAGARRVYAVDEGAIVETARGFAGANGYADRVTFIREHSSRAVLPEPVDLVVCDQVGHLGIEAGVFDDLFDARRRFLKPGGRTVPAAITIVAAPVESDALRDRLAFWRSRPAGLDVAGAREIARNTGYPFLVDPSQLLARHVALATVPLPPVRLEPIRGAATCTIERAGTVDGVCAWFSAELAPGVHMTNEPGHPQRIDRRAALLPIDAPARVERGDVVHVEMRMLPPDVVSWRVTVSPAAAPAGHAVTSDHSTFRGMLISREDLARTHPDSRPVLTPAGEARRTVLELCDGVRSLRGVQDEVYARHRGLFASWNDAALFVAEVVTRYTVADGPVSNRQPHDR